MPSLIPNFEYDIFVSYRHNDNLDGWVTEFVQNLEKELKATVKDPLTIYFDKNPHDGLLETNSVDKSLEGKLKCLIFIPIISQTYCDPKCFAWQHEFCAFNKLSREDQFGRNIKLSNGNVSSRILPIKIHDLDEEDKKAIENETGDVLRGIDFIFTSPGVSRPLRANEDHPQDNTSKTFYRDQINKVARGIKELIQAMQRPAQVSAGKTVTPASTPPGKTNYSLVGALLLVLALGGYGIFYFINRGQASEAVRDKSIAVLPFKNMSEDKSQAWFSDGMMDEILNQLAKIRELKVSSRTSSMRYRDSDKSLKEIAQELGVAAVLEGSVQRSGDRVRIIAQLIDANTDKHLWSESYDRNLSDVFAIQTEISTTIARQMKILLSPEEREQLEFIPTRNQEAYDNYLRARALEQEADFSGAVDYYTRAISLDSSFALAYADRATNRAGSVHNEDWERIASLAKADMQKALTLAPDRIDLKVRQAVVVYATEYDYDKAQQILEGLTERYPNNSDFWSTMGLVQRRKGLWLSSISSLKRAIDLDSGNSSLHYELGRTYYAIRDFKSALSEFRPGKGLGPWYPSSCYINLSQPEKAFQVADDGMRNLTDKILKNKEDSSIVAWVVVDLSLLQRRFKDALAVNSRFCPDSSLSNLISARIYYSMGNQASAKKHGLRAAGLYTQMLKRSPRDHVILHRLSLALAYAGQCEKAIQTAKEAVKIMPVTGDTFVDGPEGEGTLCKVYLICNGIDEGLDKVEYLLTLPGGYNPLTVEYLKIDPWYDKLRKVPRFQKILETTYKTVY